MKQKKPELLAPVGNKEMLIAAVNSGANAVYFGLDKLNMRAKAKNFTLENLSETINAKYPSFFKSFKAFSKK